MIKIPEQCDVLVVGGGPGGSVLAATLGQQGYDVVLLERKKHPRYAVGESIIPDFWKYLDRIGASQKIEAEGFIVKAGGVVTWDGNSVATRFSDFGYDRPALHVERDRFDHILLQHAAEQGVQVFEETSVTRVNFADGPSPVATYRCLSDGSHGRIKAAYIVDASGQSAVVGNQLGLREIDDDFRYMSVWGYFKGSRYLDQDGRVCSDASVREIPPVTTVVSLEGSDDAGWSWHIPLREETSVGLVLPLSLLKDGRIDGEKWETYLERRCRTTPILGKLLSQAEFVQGSTRLIRSYSYRSKALAGPGFYLIGDAAGFVDPIFSVGVVIAMYSGALAAWSIVQSLKKPESAERFQHLFASQLAARLEVARSLSLPRYQAKDQASQSVKSTVRLLGSNQQDLMYTASSMTTRSENFVDMMGMQQTAETSLKIRRLDNLELD